MESRAKAVDGPTDFEREPQRGCFDLVSVCFHGIKDVRNLTIFYLDSIDPRDLGVADLLLGRDNGPDKQVVLDLWKSPQHTIYETVESDNGTIVRLVNYKLHSENQCAISFRSEYNVWFRRGKLHRDGGPAVVLESWCQFATDGKTGFTANQRWPVQVYTDCSKEGDNDLIALQRGDLKLPARRTFSEEVKNSIFNMVQARGMFSSTRFTLFTATLFRMDHGS